MSKKILKEKNIEVRREAIKKIGNTLFFEQLKAKVIDEKNIYVEDNQSVNENKIGLKINYQLCEFDGGLPQKIKVLKMKNPSVEGIYHYECVPFECNTVDGALEFRNGERCLPVYLS